MSELEQAFEAWLHSIECAVCGNSPGEDGEIHHGKGCYVVSEDGGGYSTAVELKDAFAAGRDQALEEAARIAHERFTYWLGWNVANAPSYMPQAPNMADGAQDVEKAIRAFKEPIP